MARPKLTDPSVAWKIYIPTSVAAALELHILDPVTAQPRYGSRSKLITTLLRGWIAEQTTPPPTGDPATLSREELIRIIRQQRKRDIATRPPQ